jgi:uncharacterized protein (TIGR03437 family)
LIINRNRLFFNHNVVYDPSMPRSTTATSSALAALLILPSLITAQTSNTWRIGTPMPTSRQGAFIGVIGQKIYVVGGDNASGLLKVNEVYDTATDSWTTAAPMPTARWVGASAVVGNILYTIGGSTTGVTNIVEAYDSSTDTWSTKSPMPISANSIYATVENGIIYVVGGFSAGSRLTTVTAYNPATNTWSMLAPMKVGKSQPSVALLGNTIIAAGGLDNSTNAITDNEGYNAATNTWTTLAPLPTARFQACFGINGGLLYTAGGHGMNGALLASMDAYDAPGNSWTTGLPPLPTAVSDPASATLGSRLYCFGGSSSGQGGGATFNAVQIYQFPLLAPSISPNGVVSASAFGGFSSVAPGGFIEIYGSNLASDARNWGGADFNGVNAPTSLDGTSVTIDGQQAFVAYISPGQVNVLIPFDIDLGLQQIEVTNAAGSSPSYAVNVSAEAPGLLTPPGFNIGGMQFVYASLPDNAYVLPVGAFPNLNSRPAVPGDIITLYGTGFGPVTPAIPAGQLVQQPNVLATDFKISIGGSPASVMYAGLAPNETGVYQFNVMVPTIPAGNVPVTFTLGGIAGVQTLYLPVGN